jgi:AraC-like DNA-binding protein
VSDPLTQIVTLLRPSASFSKLVAAHGRWAVQRSKGAGPFYCAVLEGSLRLSVAGHQPVALERGDFALIPAAYEATTSSPEPPPPGVETRHVESSPGVFRLGHPDAPPSVRMFVGHLACGSDDAGLLVSLLPQVVHVRGQERLITLVELVNQESRSDRPGRDTILARLLDVLLIEAIRSTSAPVGPPGLLRGLADARLAIALRCMHERPTHDWRAPELARQAGLSRSAFFERFGREVGVAPMEYLLAWRMALAKDLLRREGLGVAEVAARVGYGSASTFSVAFARHVGATAVQYARG